MNKPVFGLLLGGVLGVFDGLSALLSAPEVKDQITTIVIGSTCKGLIAGLATGFFARKFHSLPLGLVVGLAIGAALAAPIALMPNENGQVYFWEIMLPGALMGLIVGYATQKHGRSPVS